MKRQLTLNEIKFEFLFRKMPNSKREVPAPGYYRLISRVPGTYTGSENTKNNHFFLAHFHPNEAEFTMQFKVPIVLWALFNNNSEGPKEYTLDELVGTVLHIQIIKPFKATFSDPNTGKETDTHSYKIVWDVVEMVEDTEVDSEFKIEDFDVEDMIELEADSELQDMLFNEDFETIDWELEEIFWELNQPINSELELLFWEANQDPDNEEESVVWEANHPVVVEEPE